MHLLVPESMKESHQVFLASSTGPLVDVLRLFSFLFHFILYLFFILFFSSSLFSSFSFIPFL